MKRSTSPTILGPATALLGAALVGCDALSDLLSDDQGSDTMPPSAGSATATQPVERTVQAPGGAELPDLEVGQWTRYRVTYPDERFTMLTHKVIGRENEALWIEIVTDRANAGTTLQILLEMKERTEPETAKVHAVKIRMPNGHVKTIRGKMLSATQESYLQMLSPLFTPPLEGSPQETITVPAGTFKGCYRHTQTVQLGGVEQKSKLQRHPAVPVSSMVRSVGSEEAITAELVNYGLSGAKSELRRER